MKSSHPHVLKAVSLVPADAEGLGQGLGLSCCCSLGLAQGRRHLVGDGGPCSLQVRPLPPPPPGPMVRQGAPQIWMEERLELRHWCVWPEQLHPPILFLAGP